MTDGAAGAGLRPGYYETREKGENSLGKAWKKNSILFLVPFPGTLVRK